MQTKQVTMSVLRTGYAQNDTTATVPANASEAQIREAVLDAANNQLFSEHSSDVELEVDSVDPGYHARKILKLLLQSLGDIGFGTDLPIEGSTAVDTVSSFFGNLTIHLQGTGIEAGVIHSESERGFWSNQCGWGDQLSATVVLDRSFTLSGFPDATFVPLEAIDVFGKTQFVSTTGMTLQQAIGAARSASPDEGSINSLADAIDVLNLATGDHSLEVQTITSAMH